jgi:hypothetical protein
MDRDDTSLIDRLRRRVAELEALVEVLRCGDLAAFMDSELDPERMGAFASHLARCEGCQRDRRGHLQVDARLRAAAAPRKPGLP